MSVDDISENNNNYTLNVPSSLPRGVTVGDLGQATVAIKDRDGKIF